MDTIIRTGKGERRMSEYGIKTKITISLTRPDADLIQKIADRTGAYSMSEVVRDALRDKWRSIAISLPQNANVVDSEG